VGYALITPMHVPGIPYIDCDCDLDLLTVQVFGILYPGI